MMSKIELIQCCRCDGSISVSKVLFKVEFMDGKIAGLCTYCTTEAIGDNPEKIKTITNIGEVF